MAEKTEVPSSGEEQNATDRVRASREPLFGTILFVCILLLGVAVLGGIGWVGYQGYRLNQKQATLPSISNLSLSVASEETEENTGSTQTIPEETTLKVADDQEETMKKAKASTIKVLNGGATKGSAAILADILKKEGYTQVTTGNTLKDYTGVVVYFSPETEKEAELVKGALIKTYPQVVAKPAIKTNTETTQAPIAIIFGK